MNEKEKTGSADDQLSDIIAKALTKEQLIASKKQDELRNKIRAGQMTEEDWQLMIESALPAVKEGEDSGKTD